jgi:hypothetical protein
LSLPAILFEGDAWVFLSGTKLAGQRKTIHPIKRSHKMFTTKNSKPLLYSLVLAASLGVGLARAVADEQDTSNDVSTSTLSLEGYCHLRFPAMHARSLASSHPELKNADAGDFVDYYGPCDHDPSGQDEINSQKEELEIRRQAGLVEG